MKKLFLNLFKLVVLFLFISCSQNERQVIDESIDDSNINLRQFNNAVNEMCSLNNIKNNIEFVKVLDNNLNPLSKLDLLENYSFQYTSSVSIKSNGSYSGILHVGTVDRNHIVVAHEQPDGSLDDLIEIKVFEKENNKWSSNVKSLNHTELQKTKPMTQAECERQTTDLVMAGSAFTGLTGWWCPPCGFAGGIATGIVAVGYFTCRL